MICVSRESALAKNDTDAMTFAPYSEILTNNIVDTCPAHLRAKLAREIGKVATMYGITTEDAEQILRTNDEHEAAAKRGMGL